MGCISSKAITRSLSIRDELTNGFQSTTSAWEELLASHSRNDQLFALIRSSNATSTKLTTSSFTLPSSDPKTPLETKNPGNVWDLIADIDGKADVESVGEADFTRFTRSKSCQTAREKELLWMSPDRLNENKLDRKDKNGIGSRSFHTVEEYDALIERIHKLSTTTIESFEDYYTPNSADENLCTPATGKDSPKKKLGVEDHDLDQDGSDSVINLGEFIEAGGARETGWKRKTVAKGLRSLDVSAVEFPGVGGFRQRIREGQVYSPGSYTTPKFGSYNAGAVEEKEKVEDTVFSAELLAEFEECMQRLQVDEDSILREMDGLEK